MNAPLRASAIQPAPCPRQMSAFAIIAAMYGYTVMVAGQIRKRAGKLVGIDVAKLTAEVTASRDYLLGASGYRPELFGASTASKSAA